MSSPRPEPSPPSRVLFALGVLATVLYTGLTSWLGLARFAAVHNRTFDLALYARLAWGPWHLQAWDPIGSGGPFGGHVSLALLPLGLLGALLGTVPVLLVAQSAAVAVAAWPIARIGWDKLGAAGAVAAACGFWLYPNFGHVTGYEFHPSTLAVLPLCLALEALERERARSLPWWCAAVVACRASLSLQTLVLGLLAAYGPSSMRRIGARIALASAAYFALWQLVLVPLSATAVHASDALHFGIWGGSPFGVVPALFRRPAFVMAHFTAPARLLYLPRVLAPLALLPLLRPRLALVALPPLLLNLASAFPTAASIDSHYLTFAVPALVAAAIDGAAALVRRVRRDGLTRVVVLGSWMAAVGVGSVASGGLPWSRDFDRAAVRADPWTSSARQVFDLVGATASVQAPDSLLPHFAERPLVARVPPPERAADFVVLDVSHRARFAGSEDLLRTIEEPLVRTWLARPDHGVVFADERLLVLQRGQSPRAGIVNRYFAGFAPADSGTALTDCLAVRGAEIVGTQLSLELVARKACPSDLAIRIGVEPKPSRVDLLFDGLLSPAHLSRGDLLRSSHRLTAAERTAIARRALRVGALRSSGAPAHAYDPVSVEVPLRALR